MGEYTHQVPEPVRGHLRALIAPAGLADNPEAQALLERGWVEKYDAFLRHTAEHDMVAAEWFDAQNPGGALAMTYSGSVVSVGPIIDRERGVAYASIGIRKDVPQLSVSQGCALEADLKLGEPARFSSGSIERTSPLFAIAIFQTVLEAHAENAALVEVTEMLTERFIQINRETIPG